MPDATAKLRVSVFYADAPRAVQQWRGSLPAGATVQDAICASGHSSLLARISTPMSETFMSESSPASNASGPPQDLGLAIWGRKAELGDVLQDRDRVEICRPLTVDPKLARRERFAQQGSRGSGLFATKRPGAKAGY